MNQSSLLTNVSKYLSRLNEQVQILNKNGDFSINKHAENALIDILNILFNCDLTNINQLKTNYPAIDLVDKKRKIAFQVSSNGKTSKLKHTISNFIKEKQYLDYENLYFFVITNKLTSYDQKDIDDFIEREFNKSNKKVKESKFTFNIKDKIIDRSDIYRILEEKNDINIIKKVDSLLKSKFHDFPDKWSDFEEGIEHYDEYIKETYKYLDIKGLSPKINSQLVKISFDCIYVPLKLKNNDLTKSKELKNDECDKRNIFDILSNFNNKIAILGDPGSGKTTYLKYIAKEISSKRYRNFFYSNLLPVYIRIADYAIFYEKTGKTIAEFLVNYFDKKYERIFLKALKENKLVLLLDGLDEITKISIRHDIINQVNIIASQYPDCFFVVTTRIVGYNQANLGAKFEHFEIESFNEIQIKQFSINWYNAISEFTDKDNVKANQLANELFNSIKDHRSVVRLATTPLLMTIIALIHYKGVRLPNKRVELYDIAVSTLLENWVYLRKNSRELNLDKKDFEEILSPIAYYIHENYSDGLITETEFRKLLVSNYSTVLNDKDLRNANRQCEEVINYLREDSGFFYEKGLNEDGESLFGFVHLTFEEYFAAIEIVQRWKEKTLNLKDIVFVPRWFEPIKLSCSLFKLKDGGRIGRNLTEQFIEDILIVKDNYKEFKRALTIVLSFFEDDIDVSQIKFESLVEEALNSICSYEFDINYNVNDEYNNHIYFVLRKILKNSLKWNLILFNTIVDFFKNTDNDDNSIKILCTLDCIDEENILYNNLKEVYFSHPKFIQIDNLSKMGFLAMSYPGFYMSEEYKKYALDNLIFKLENKKKLEELDYEIIDRAFAATCGLNYTGFDENDYSAFLNNLNNNKIIEFFLKFTINLELEDPQSVNLSYLKMIYKRLKKEFSYIDFVFMQNYIKYFTFRQLNEMQLKTIYSNQDYSFRHSTSIVQINDIYYLQTLCFDKIQVEEIKMDKKTLNSVGISDELICLLNKLLYSNDFSENEVKIFFKYSENIGHYLFYEKEFNRKAIMFVLDRIDIKENLNYFITESNVFIYIMLEKLNKYQNIKFYNRILNSKYLTVTEKCILLYRLEVEISFYKDLLPEVYNEYTECNNKKIKAHIYNLFSDILNLYSYYI